MLGRHTIHTSSTTQIPISLSSGEAEFYAAVKTASRLIGTLALAKDLGVELGGRLFTDSAAAKGVFSRRGCGKVRHLETPTLWVQKAVQDKRFTLHKVDGKRNPADLGVNLLTRQQC
jgi:hypothetical protein